MKAKLDAIIQREQAEYLDRLLTQSDPLLAEMEEYAAEHRVPIADREVARFVEITARVSGARKALEVMPNLKDTFDLLFIDALKEEYSQYLDLGLQRLRSGGVVIVDNLLWGGKVATGDSESSTVALREFNPYFINHPQLIAEVLAVGDGLGYGVKL